MILIIYLEIFKIFETIYSIMVIGGRIDVGRDNERIEVGNFSGSYRKDLKLLMVKKFIMSWIKINENGNVEINISNIL